MKVYALLQSDENDMRKYNEILRTLKIDEPIKLDGLMDYIFTSRFIPTSSKSGVRQFDYLKDYDLLYAIFRKDYGINLQTDNLQWWEFTFILEEIMLGDNSLTRRMGFRAYKEPKKIDDSNRDYDKAHKNLRLQYNITEQDVDKELGKMFKSLEKE